MRLFAKLAVFLTLFPFLGIAQTLVFVPLVTDAKTSMRGLAVVNQDVIWVSGSNGYVGKSVNGGKTWEWLQPKGYETLDFRDIQAFDADKAIIINAGSPAYVLTTLDGGKTWRENYKNTDTAIFLDGMDFWDPQNGIIFGDPINGKMQLLRTTDGGSTWQNISHQLTLPMQKGEAGFAASGTTIKTYGKGKVWVATGGVVSNIYQSHDYGNTWQVYACPIIQGEASTGTFSIDFFDTKKGVAVGGNYLKDKDNSNNVLYTTNGGKSWRKPSVPVSGYRSGVAYITKNICLATGTSGTDISTDGGKTWRNISALSFNAVKALGNGAILVGGKGQVYKANILP
ncbi:WD40/YVTN/BNR-like repeat-containing protein [Pedobacter sp. SL55]|uniref:WD40/YVTN/BNR-like repeat-containing protein n=1 Tax=Pedobacter sp. SL55 TaxID=2995161 RepID=UPI00226E6EFC|nr:YCF48-related protein [Pedobacter sp. SL55]WAC39520.1 YCF48-related protein [Pedobacter sp. SL55]